MPFGWLARSLMTLIRLRFLSGPHRAPATLGFSDTPASAPSHILPKPAPGEQHPSKTASHVAADTNHVAVRLGNPRILAIVSAMWEVFGATYHCILEVRCLVQRITAS
jgi:hypothetical protein